MRLPRFSLCVTLALAGCRARPGPLHLAAEGALGPYSAAVEAGGLVFLSGKVGRAGGSFAEELGSALDAVEQDLARLSLSLADVVSVNVFLTDMRDHAALNEVYGARLPRPHPARTTVAVSALPGARRVEVQAVAMRRRDG